MANTAFPTNPGVASHACSNGFGKQFHRNDTRHDCLDVDRTAMSFEQGARSLKSSVPEEIRVDLGEFTGRRERLRGWVSPALKRETVARNQLMSLHEPSSGTGTTMKVGIVQHCAHIVGCGDFTRVDTYAGTMGPGRFGARRNFGPFQPGTPTRSALISQSSPARTRPDAALAALARKHLPRSGSVVLDR